MKYNKGFTLIELLVVIAIIGILSSVVLASLNSARQKSRDARRISDIKQLQVALELYYSDNNAYPVETTSGGEAVEDSTNLADVVTDGYIAVMPTDPGSNTYYYHSPTGGATYCLGVDLEDANNTALSSTDSACVTTLSNLTENEYAVSP